MKFKPFMLTPEMAYCTNNPEALIGPPWRATGEFRIPRIGEHYLGIGGGVFKYTVEEFTGPRIILSDDKDFFDKWRFAKGIQPRKAELGDFYLSDKSVPSKSVMYPKDRLVFVIEPVEGFEPKPNADFLLE